MAKLTLTTPASGGDLLPDITEARLLNAQVDFNRNRANCVVVYGAEVDGVFQQSPINPPGGQQVVVDFEQYTDVQVAWNNFQRKLLQRGSSEGIFPPGTDSD